MFWFKKTSPQPHIIHTYTHILGVTPERFSEDEKRMIAQLVPVINKVLKNKLMVVNVVAHHDNIDYFNKCKWKVEVLEELLNFFSNYELELEKDDTVIPLSNRHF